MRFPAAPFSLVAVCLAACTHPPEETPQQLVEDRLVGTWLREYDQDTARIRRVLVLESDRSFRELAVVSGAGLGALQLEHAGEWRFDGTNLKRRYTSLDGKKPAAPIVPFATFELHFQSPDEFRGVDHVHRREIRYRRVGEGTRP